MTMITGMMSATIQPPLVNLVTIWISETHAVATAPIPLSVARRRQPGSLLRTQCTTMPACDSVKQTKTPIA